MLTLRNDDAQLVLGGGQVVAALVAQADDDGPDQVADAEAVLHGDLVLLGGPDVLAADLGAKGGAADGGFGGHVCSAGRGDDEDVGGGKADAEAGDAGEDVGVDLWQDIVVVVESGGARGRDGQQGQLGGGGIGRRRGDDLAGDGGVDGGLVHVRAGAGGVAGGGPQEGAWEGDGGKRHGSGGGGVVAGGGRRDTEREEGREGVCVYVC